MPFRHLRIYFLWLILLLVHGFCRPIVAQGQRARGWASAPTLRQLTRTSGYIFAGTVTSVTRVAMAKPGEVATVRVTFHVDQGIRGVRAGQTLTIREWAGLWDSGERYRVGERVFLFLYRPSRLGLTSPVGGPQGRFALDQKGRVVLQQERMEALSVDPVFTARLRGKSLVSRRDFANVIRRAGEE